MNMISKTTLFTNWHTMRLVALAIGIFLAVMAVWYQDMVTGFLSAFFVFQAVTNTGCMVAQSCGVPPTGESKTDTDQEINYTEVK